MVVGPVYRFRVTNIPLAPGIEVFPTVEIVDRLYPPPGQELRFPIPVELTAEELLMAAGGKFVTRVIYVENPHSAVPMADDEKHQSWFDVGPGKSPLKVARNLGRPVAVLRLGGRLPDPGVGVDIGFLCGCPPLVHFNPNDAPINTLTPEHGPKTLADKRPVPPIVREEPPNGVKTLSPPPAGAKNSNTRRELLR
jgi:hypothetical protein